MKEKDIEEMQIEFFNILGNIKLFLDNGKYDTAKQYVAQEYYILKNELADDDQSQN